jgi:hypothetical protein
MAPLFILFVQMAYVSSDGKKGIFTSGGFLPLIPIIDAFEFLNPLHQVFQFNVIDLDLSLNSIQFPQQLLDPHVHNIHDELLEKDRKTEDHQDICFKCHDLTRTLCTSRGSKFLLSSVTSPPDSSILQFHNLLAE